jgi:hypothetical protein
MELARVLRFTRVLLITVIPSMICGCGSSNTMTADPFPGDSSNDPTELTISAGAGENGSITPSGDVKVKRHGSVDFLIVPIEGYQVDSVFVDDSYRGRLINYSFTNVTKPHSIRASFVPIK